MEINLVVAVGMIIFGLSSFVWSYLSFIKFLVEQEKEETAYIQFLLGAALLNISIIVADAKWFDSRFINFGSAFFVVIIFCRMCVLSARNSTKTHSPRRQKIKSNASFGYESSQAHIFLPHFDRSYSRITSKPTMLQYLQCSAENEKSFSAS